MTDSLFPEDQTAHTDVDAPLAERMRPKDFDEFVGQDELLAPGQPLREPTQIQSPGAMASADSEQTPTMSSNLPGRLA